jgi:hypothetical protein
MDDRNRPIIADIRNTLSGDEANERDWRAALTSVPRRDLYTPSG